MSVLPPAPEITALADEPLTPSRPRLRPTRRGLVRALLWLPAVLVVVIAVAGPWLTSADPGRVVGLPYTPPGDGLRLGTDGQGRDVWVRLLTGGRPLVITPAIAVAITAVLGTALGITAGYLGGPVDFVVSRLDGLLLAIPPVLVLLLVLQGWGFSAASLVAVVVLTGTPFVSRVARASTLQVMNTGYVEQAVALGESPPSVIVREILPMVIRPILADAGTRLSFAVSITATASFLGFGPDRPNWGAMISQNLEGVSLTAWPVVGPAVCLTALAVAANRALDRFSTRLEG